MSATTELAAGYIATEAGADKLRGELLSAHAVRCGNHWTAAAEVFSDGAAEITVSTGYDAASKSWQQHEYYYSFEKATAALRQFEATGTLPTEDQL